MRMILCIAFCLGAFLGFGQDTLSFLKVGDFGSEEGVEIVSFNDSTYYILANTADEFNNSDYQLIPYNPDIGVSSAVNYGTLNSDRALDLTCRDPKIFVVGMTNGNTASYEGFVHGIEGDSLSFQYYWGTGVANTWWQASQIEVIDTIIYVLFEDVNQKEVPQLHKLSLSGQPIEAIELEGLVGANFSELHFDEHTQTLRACGKRLNQAANQDAFFYAFDLQLEEQWSYVFEEDGDEVFTDFARLNDTSVIIVGYTNSLFEEDDDILVIRLNELSLSPDSILVQGYDSGNVVNRDDRAYGVFIDNDTIFITGETQTYGQGGVDGYITLLNPDLIPIPRGSTFGTPGDDYSFTLHKDGNALFGVGTTYERTKGLSDVLLWRRDAFDNTTLFTSVEDFFLVSTGLVLNSEELVGDASNEEGLFANIEQGGFRLKSSIWDRTNEVQVYNSIGQRVTDLNSFKEEVYGLPSGVYFLLYKGDFSEVSTTKFFIP